MNVELVLAGCVAILAVYLIRRGLDVRLVLFSAGLVIAGIAGTPWVVFDAFQKSVGRADIIGPICSAMGFAYVVKRTRSDADMVRLLVRPLRRARWALIPGGAAIGFITNMAITSQTAAAAAVGPILVPLMIAAGYSRLTAAATLLVGCSVGGNLFNPAEPDIVAVQTNAGVGVDQVLNTMITPNLLSFIVAVALLTIMQWRHHDDRNADVDLGADTAPISYLRAFLVPLPVIVLLLLQPGLKLIPSLFELYPNGLHVSTVMLVCSFLVMLESLRGREASVMKQCSAITESFFEGMGFGFTKVISLIIAASCFIAGLDAVGAITKLSAIFGTNLGLAALIAPILTFVLAVISGSGTAPSVSFSQAMLPGVAATDAAGAVSLGAFGAIGASVGRTTSPVSAIMLFTATLADVDAASLVRIVMWPMLASLGSVILYGVLF